MITKYEVRIYSHSIDWPSFEFTGTVKDLIEYTDKLMKDHGAEKCRMIDHENKLESYLCRSFFDFGEGLKEEIDFYEYKD